MKQIASALVKAQKAFGPALKSATNPHFKTKYADLSACVEAVIDSLNENGIALIQKNHLDDSGVTVETVFVHESGEMLDCGKLHVPAAKNDPQGYGSALTYARRYSLMAACGIAPEDDDGNAGAAAKRQQDENNRQRPALDTSPKARAQRIIEGVSKGDEVNAAAAMAGWEDGLRDAVWNLLPAKVQDKLTAAWPQEPATT
jgi:hypothetical protein